MSIEQLESKLLQLDDPSNTRRPTEAAAENAKSLLRWCRRFGFNPIQINTPSSGCIAIGFTDGTVVWCMNNGRIRGDARGDAEQLQKSLGR